DMTIIFTNAAAAELTGVFNSEFFFWGGMADYDFTMDEEFYINILDFIRHNNGGSFGALAGAIAIQGTFTNIDTNTASNFSGAVGFQSRHNVMENPVGTTQGAYTAFG
ncbi:MAG: hypothetical protein ACYDBH_12235, partial [Acidobacteriaceae bacterium]